MFDLHEKKGKHPHEITQEVNNWLKKAGNITVFTEDSSPTEISNGYFLWTIWYEDLNDDTENGSIAYKSLESEE